MLRIIAQSSAAGAKSYYTQGDYYTSGLELDGVWGGRGAAMLGLTGLAEKADFDALCDNLNPRTGEPLTARTRADRRVLYDWSFSVPKSVSLAYELGGDERILNAFRTSVEETMKEAEAEMKTRVRTHGQEFDRTTGNMIWTMFIHRTTRPSKEDQLPDPQLHAHVAVQNATWDPEERRWKASQQGDLKRDSPYWQAAFNARMAKRMADFGYAITRTADAWELADLPPTLNQKFSRRTQEIDQLAADLGITDPARKDKLGATSRLAKVKATIENLQSYWLGRLTPDETTTITTVRSNAERGLAARPTVTAEASMRYAIAHVFERESVVSEKRLIAEALRYGAGSVLPDDVRREADQTNLLKTVLDGQVVTTTREVLAEEQRLFRFAREGRGRCRPLKPGHIIQRTFLNEEQRHVVRHVLESPDRVLLIRGAAGTGKTTNMQEAVEAIHDAGVPLAVLAPSVKASRGVLRKEVTADANTVASFLLNREWQDTVQGGVIWVDEVGLLGNADLARVFEVADRLAARVVLQGDSHQHGSISRGPALKLLETHAGLPVFSLTEIKRQSGAYRDAVQLLSKGRIADGFDSLDGMGWVREVPDADRNQLVAEEYLKRVDEHSSVLVVSPTHAEGRAVTEAIRDRRKARGELTDEREFDQLIPAHFTEAQKADPVNYQPTDVLRFHQPYKGIRPGGRKAVSEWDTLPLQEAKRFSVFHRGMVKLAVGDPIRLTAGGRSKDGSKVLANGDQFTIEGFTPQGDLKLNGGVVLDKSFGTLAPGYVQTSHASQGSTTDHVLIVQSAESLAASNAEQLYVSASRGRKSATIFTDDTAALRSAVQRLDSRRSATELFDPRGRVDSLAKRVGFMQRLKGLNRVREAVRVGPRDRGRDLVLDS